MAGLDPSIFERQRRAIGDQYTQSAASNALGRFVSQQRGDRQTADYTQSYQRSAPKLTAAYGHRGLAGGGVQSGVYQNAMRNYVGDYQQQLNRGYADTQTELNQADLNMANLTANRDRAYADIEVDKAKEIANAASYLTSLKDQFGGG